MEIKVLQLHKPSSVAFENIQDKFAINLEHKVVALADGSTQSWNSGKWAQLLTSRFAENPVFDIQELTSVLKGIAHEFSQQEHPSSPNPAIASLEKTKKANGSTSTFLGLRINPDKHLEVVTCGDTNLFLIRDETNIISFPHINADSLENNKKFINTRLILEDRISSDFFSYFSTEYFPSDIIILATDALSQLIFSDQSIIKRLLTISTFDELLEFCSDKWNRGLLQEDDISAIIINLSRSDNVLYMLPSSEFKFNEENYNPYEISKYETLKPEFMEEIYAWLKANNEKLELIEKKVLIIRLLLYIIIMLLFLNFIFLVLVYHDDLYGAYKPTEKKPGYNLESKINTSVKKSNRIVNYF